VRPLFRACSASPNIDHHRTAESPLAASVGAVLEADQRGCQLDRKMDDLIRAAGFQINSIKTCHMAEALDIVRAVDRDLQDDHSPPHMDRHQQPR